jgi:hypothetical protein
MWRTFFQRQARCAVIARSLEIFSIVIGGIRFVLSGLSFENCSGSIPSTMEIGCLFIS